jgi:hypothetical protein
MQSYDLFSETGDLIMIDFQLFDKSTQLKKCGDHQYNRHDQRNDLHI